MFVNTGYKIICMYCSIIKDLPQNKNYESKHEKGEKQANLSLSIN